MSYLDKLSSFVKPSPKSKEVKWPSFLWPYGEKVITELKTLLVSSMSSLEVVFSAANLSVAELARADSKTISDCSMQCK